MNYQSLLVCLSLLSFASMPGAGEKGEIYENKVTSKDYINDPQCDFAQAMEKRSFLTKGVACNLLGGEIRTADNNECCITTPEGDHMHFKLDQITQVNPDRTFTIPQDGRFNSLMKINNDETSLNFFYDPSVRLERFAFSADMTRFVVIGFPCDDPFSLKAWVYKIEEKGKHECEGCYLPQKKYWGERYLYDRVVALSNDGKKLALVSKNTDHLDVDIKVFSLENGKVLLEDGYVNSEIESFEERMMTICSVTVNNVLFDPQGTVVGVNITNRKLHNRQPMTYYWDF